MPKPSSDNPPPDLAAIQRWMQAVITYSGGVAAGVDSPAARREIEVTAGDVEQIVARSEALSSLDRLAVYGNAYFARLLGCLRDEFPALAHALGEEAFDGLAFGYLQSHPSQSYTLADLGAGFPQYLGDTRPDEHEPRPNWTDFVIGLAELERTYAEVFDGPGPEGRQLLQVDDLLAIGPQAWPDARLATVEWLRLRAFQYPVHEYASAVRRHDAYPAPPAAKPTWLAITRRDYVVRRIPLSHVQFRLLSALSDGHTIGESLAAAGDESDESALLSPENVRRWFTEWAAAGFFSGIAKRIDHGTN